MLQSLVVMTLPTALLNLELIALIENAFAKPRLSC
jgi:hypothetical protein